MSPRAQVRSAPGGRTGDVRPCHGPKLVRSVTQSPQKGQISCKTHHNKIWAPVHKRDFAFDGTKPPKLNRATYARAGRRLPDARGRLEPIELREFAPVDRRQVRARIVCVNNRGAQRSLARRSYPDVARSKRPIRCFRGDGRLHRTIRDRVATTRGRIALL